ncbi:MAG: response regulator [Planctomycetota bacterium]|nr:response regulator [Planctomycetota bacterium]
MSTEQKPRILCFGREAEKTREFAERLQSLCDVVCPDSIEDSLEILQTGGFSGLFLCGSEMTSAGLLLQAGGILQQLHDGLALVGSNREVLWYNRRLQEITGQSESLNGKSFYGCFGTAEILGPDFCPLNTALGLGESARSTLRVGDKTYFDVEATPVFDGTPDEFAIPRYLIVVVRDTSTEVLQKQKLNAIYQAGMELGDLTPQELLEMTVEDRIELLKSKLLHFTQDLLEYDTVEIRLLDRKTKRLDPLLSAGMHKVAQGRTLHALPQENGVTGFVAATGKSYLCEDTTTDPLYILGATEARSSLTVPLMLHDEVLGTFNVESPRPQGFSESDLQFLELFAREIAVALNTLELLAVEKGSTASESTKLILTEVGEPVDEILQDATWLLENMTTAEPEVRDRLRDILKHTRDIKVLIQAVGETIRPKAGHVSLESNIRPKMQHKRVLVVDSDNDVRKAAHELLGRFGCHVETAHDAEECFLLARSCHYDAVIADIRLPDHNGYEVFEQLRQIDGNLPVILMTGYGYDPAHSLVKARQAGCMSVLFKPFRIDLLVTELEKAFTLPAELSEQSTT